MIVIYAEKPNLGAKIAAAIDKITLDNGTIVTTETLDKYSDAVTKMQKRDMRLYADYNGKKYCVIWGYGHLCELKRERDYNPDYANWYKLPIPFFPPMETKPKEGTVRYYNNAKEFFAKAEYIVNATDDDMEGELLFAYLYEQLGIKKDVKRMFLSSYTRNGIRKSLDSVVDGSTRERVVQAGKARSHSDFIIGANITALLTRKNKGVGIVSVGRVQTTILNILVQRELEIQKFKSSDYYTVEAEFTTSAGETYLGVYEKDRFDSKSDAEKIAKSAIGKGIVTSVQTDVSFVSAPELYNLAALQKDANVKFGFTMDETLNIAQKLYESGYTTYARTSSRYLNEDKEDDMKKLLDILEGYSPEYKKALTGRSRVFKKGKYFDDSKVGSHFAIIPTGKLPKSLSSNEQKIYDLIAISVANMVSEDAEVSHTKMITEVNGCKFISSGKSIVKLGWMELSGRPKEKLLPALNKGDETSSHIEVITKKTKPPKRFTDATLLTELLTAGKKLEDKELRQALLNSKNEGVGTDSTRAATVENLIKRDYVKREAKKLIATEKGIKLIETIPIDDLKTPATTAKWQMRLNAIEEGKDTYDSFISDVKADVTKWCQLIDGMASTISTQKNDNVVGVCPICGKDVVAMKWGYGCSGYKEGCKFSVGELAKKKISATHVKQLLKNGKTGLIKGFTSKKGTNFDAYLFLEDGKVKFEFPEKENKK